MTSAVKKFSMMAIAVVLLMALAFAGAASAVEEDGIEAADTYDEVWVDDTGQEKHYPTLMQAYDNVSNAGTIHLNKTVKLTETLRIDKALTIDGQSDDGTTIHTIQSAYDSKTELLDGHLLEIILKKAGEDITLKNLIIDFKDQSGNILISDSSSSGTTQFKAKLNQVTLQNMSTDPILDTRSVIEIKAADVEAKELKIVMPSDPTLVDRWVATIDMQSREGRNPSKLTIDALPYGAYCKGTPQAEVWKITNGGMLEPVVPIEIELPFVGETLYVWPGFGATTHEVTDWDNLADTIASGSVEYGHTLKLTQDIISDGDPSQIEIPAGVIINATNSSSKWPYRINIIAGDSIVVNDLLGLATLLGYSAQVAYGDGHIILGTDFIVGSYVKIPKDTTIQIDMSSSGTDKNNVTVDLPDDATIPVDEYGIISLRENKNLTVTGDGAITFTNDPRGNSTSLWINGTLNLYTKVTQWPSLGINGTGTVNILNPESKMPEKMPEAMKDNLSVAPITVSGSGNGKILDKDEHQVDASKLLVKYNSSWTISSDKLNLTITNATGSESYILSPNAGYTAQWVVKNSKSVNSNADDGNLVVAGQFEAVFTKNSQPVTPTHKESGYTQILQEGQVAPTLTPTATPTPTAKPTVQPIENPTVKPTATQTQKSPAPFVGLIAGLGAALVIARMRR